MITDDISTLPKNQRLLGLDLGEKTIGVAFSDIFQTIATPVEVIKRKKFMLDAEKIFQLYDNSIMGAIIIGLPLNMDGTEGARCQSTRQFARNLLKIRDVPIFLQDERMSSQAVERTMNIAELHFGRKKELVDKMAAAHILQSVIDRRRTATTD